MAFTRTGLRTVRNIAFALCKLVTISTPIIRKAYPSNAALLVALDAAVLACAALVAEADLALPVGD